MLKRIVIIGNAGAGKTTLSRALSQHHSLPVTHVDSIQFLPGMKIRPHAESIRILTEVEAGESWIIDGYGPLDIIERRFQAADKIIFIDFPIWRHYFWCAKRQLKNAFKRRVELPEGCDEFSLAQTNKLFRSIRQEYLKMRPELTRILNRENLKSKLIWVRTYSEWLRLFQNGV